MLSCYYLVQIGFQTRCRNLPFCPSQIEILILAQILNIAQLHLKICLKSSPFSVFSEMSF